MLKLEATAIFVCAASIAVSCFGQNPAFFNTITTTTTAPGARNAYSVDVNNDGIPDIITENTGLPGGFTVFVSNGNGTFKSTYSYTFPAPQYEGITPVAYGDFNGDGKVDLVVQLAGAAQLAFFAGNGNGTFQAPVYETLTLPTGQHFGGNEMLVADFTGDGKLDLITETNTNSAGNLVLMAGEGNGHFGAAKVIYTPPANSGTGWSLQLGDFDADGKADFAFTDSSNCTQGGCSTGTLHVEYGDGAGSFTDTTPYISSGYVFTFNTADLNNDGKTDIVGFSAVGVPQMITLYGQTDRTFHLYTLSTGLSSGSNLLPPVIADFNGDGANDVASAGSDYASHANLVLVMLGNNTPGTFTRDQTNVSLGANEEVLAGDFNRDTKPDIAWTYNGSSAVELVTEENATPTGTFTSGCAYPAKGQGINACTVAGSASSPTVFHATANSFGKIRKLELWVDGKKIGEQWHDWADHNIFFNLSTTIAAGNHSATYYAADVDNRLQRSDFSFSVGAACSAPAGAGVHVCSPVNNSTVSSPVRVTAAATITSTLARMEVWVDGVKKYTETTSQSLNTTVSLGAAKHRFDIYAVNTAGTKWETTVYATVN